MKTFLYFPGCTLTNKAKGLNETAKQCSKVLGIELVELENWYCCQADFSTLTDNLMSHLAPVRTLVSARKTSDKLVTLCSTCYYVLKRVNYLIENDAQKRKTVFDFLEEEYKGPIKIVHFLELIRDEIGFEKLKEYVKRNLENIKVAAYYGCQLLRPKKEIAFDDPKNPVIFEQFLNALGCKTVDYPFKAECCGAFLTISNQEIVDDCVSKIIKYAVKNGAEAITTSCPLCFYNLDWSQKAISQDNKEFKSIPVLYLTELMSLSLGIEMPNYIWDEHTIDPRPFLEKKGIPPHQLNQCNGVRGNL